MVYSFRYTSPAASRQPVLALLRSDESCWKRVGKGCVLIDIVIQSGDIVQIVVPRRPSVLPVSGEVHSVIEACSAAHYCFTVQPVGESEARSDVMVSGIRVPLFIRGQDRGAVKLPHSWYINAAITDKARERLAIIALRIGCAELVSQTQIRSEERRGR